MHLKDKQKFINWRVHFLMVIVFLVALYILSQLFVLQVLKYDIYEALAQAQYKSNISLLPKRGEIFIEDLYSDQLYPLATNRELWVCWVVPKQIQNPDNAASKLASILDLPEKEIIKKLSKPGDPYEVLKHKLTEETAQKIKELKIRGVGLTPENWRYYPEGAFASHLLGFVGYSGGKRKGQYGVEGYYNKVLEGSAGFLSSERDVKGRWIAVGQRNFTPAQDGDDLVLTIDHTIQFTAEEKIREAVNRFGADGGSIIVMDPRSGAITALANSSSFDPNNYSEVAGLNVFLNPAIHYLFEPGSVFKPITMAAALDTGSVTPETLYEDKGVVSLDGYNIRNSDGRAHGFKTMTEVLEESLNTGAIFVLERTGKSTFLRYVRDFGFDVPTGVDLEGEAEGDISNLSVKNDINYATASFGQGISVTPMELIVAISAIANDGKLMQPYIVDKFIHHNGTISKTEPKMVRQVISPKTANCLAAMMVSVVRNGYGKKAGVDGYNVAGKTGTAQVPNIEGRGYSDKTIHTFVGFGPVPNPRFVIFIKLDNPKGIRFASDSVAPVFRELAEFLFSYYQIPPE